MLTMRVPFALATWLKARAPRDDGFPGNRIIRPLKNPRAWVVAIANSIDGLWKNSGFGGIPTPFFIGSFFFSTRAAVKVWIISIVVPFVRVLGSPLFFVYLSAHILLGSSCHVGYGLVARSVIRSSRIFNTCDPKGHCNGRLCVLQCYKWL